MSKPASQNDGGWQLPEIVDPERIEFCISVPNEPAHLRAFWGTLWDLTRWFNWQEDDEHTAKAVADVWKVVWMENQYRYEERVCMPPEACCDDTNDLLRQILAIMKDGFKIVPFASELPSDFTVDCTPDDFTGNDGESPLEKIKRQNALCLAVNRWLVSILGNRAVKMNKSNLLNDIWALGGFTSAPKMYAQIQYVEFAFTVAQLQSIIDDETAFQAVACLIVQELANEGNTFSIFKKLLQNVYDAVSAEENVAMTLVALVAKEYAADRVNYTLFSKELEAAYEDIDEGDDYACLCFGGVCDVEDFVLMSTDGATAEQIEPNKWRFTVPSFTMEGDIQVWKFTFRDAFWRCFNHTGSVGYAQSYWRQYNCAGVFGEGVGGGGGLITQEEVTIGLPLGDHITPPLIHDIIIACP